MLQMPRNDWPKYMRNTKGLVTMPYINQKRRDAMACTLTPQPSAPETPGELNYAITMLLVAYWQRGPLPGNYTRINDISGACTEALAEFRRRVVGKYEDQKIIENGDVYT